MAGKMARSGCPTTIRVRGRVATTRYRAPVLREGRKSASVHAKSGFIWGIPVGKQCGTSPCARLRASVSLLHLSK
jgi:hypothetical protein